MNRKKNLSPGEKKFNISFVGAIVTHSVIVTDVSV
jgi:hypothetical protein